ncbi:hypothetical protein P152DRAFT_21181 [Eremomyces bilateralis CBS 781.70]|uniref:Uncharacterized protein n=1 Tax=Eremomyces bilateralis CBS 781.70 TaxID=1392243 RepID=A0A6G1GHS6_9PEZI|nr:uncharacterized protein P152DRAFT_21181 [Eremomyces bilateralis CBS 781.70]KAF1817506.1 hypothetical protein P152DRAFT_21181 [Eremomyces bilateralis CBS 781.70]
MTGGTPRGGPSHPIFHFRSSLRAKCSGSLQEDGGVERMECLGEPPSSPFHISPSHVTRHLRFSRPPNCHDRGFPAHGTATPRLDLSPVAGTDQQSGSRSQTGTRVCSQGGNGRDSLPYTLGRPLWVGGGGMVGWRIRNWQCKNAIEKDTQ